MIDLHSHILPNLDDGAKDLIESMAMAKLATENGITAIAATPHHKNGRYNNEKNSIEAAVKALNANIQTIYMKGLAHLLKITWKTGISRRSNEDK
ncbi:CpsB/CapC family capsule biosynthesis tyrosine phosphatase [Domibacillus iocasae]